MRLRRNCGRVGVSHVPGCDDASLHEVGFAIASAMGQSDLLRLFGINPRGIPKACAGVIVHQFLQVVLNLTDQIIQIFQIICFIYITRVWNVLTCVKRCCKCYNGIIWDLCVCVCSENTVNTVIYDHMSYLIYMSYDVICVKIVKCVKCVKHV